MSIMQKLDSSYQFENFVSGKANQFATAAAMQVVNSLGAIYNPLYIYGGIGVGKTHLLQAIGNQLMKENSQAKICYVHAAHYASGVVRALQAKQLDEFRNYFNSLDLLLIDDIQFIADKSRTQNEFMYTLDSLANANKQVVISCDKLPEASHNFML